MMARRRAEAGTWRAELSAALAVALMAALVAWADGPIALRLPLGLVAVLILPGYTLTTLVFARNDLDTVERLGLSFGLSLAVLAVIAIVLNATPWGFGYGPIVATITGWTTLTLVGAWTRSRRLASAAVPLGDARPRSRPAPTRVLAIGLAAVLAVVVLAYGSIVLEPPPDATELYLLGPRGWGADLPRSIRVGESVPVTIGIANREGEATAYRVRADVDGTTLADVGPIRLAAGERWEGPLALAPARVGHDQEIVVTLRVPGSTTPYRTVRLWLDVLPSRDEAGQHGSGAGAVLTPEPGTPGLGSDR